MTSWHLGRDGQAHCFDGVRIGRSLRGSSQSRRRSGCRTTVQAALASAENDLREARRERDVANARLASVRAHRRALRDELVEARKVVESAKQKFAPLTGETEAEDAATEKRNGIGLYNAIVDYSNHVAARRTSGVDDCDDGGALGVAETRAAEDTKP